MERNRKVSLMKKKLSLFLCLAAMALCLSACGGDAESEDYFGRGYDEWKSSMEQEVAALVSLDDQSRAYIQQNGTKAAQGLVESWDAATEGLGQYQGNGDFDITQTSDTLTAEQEVLFDERSVIVSYVYKYNYETEQLELADATCDKVYTLGEKMTKAALNTLMGMGTVFAVLILISLIIYCFKFISQYQAKAAAKKEAAAQNGAGASGAAPAASPAPAAPIAVMPAAEAGPSEEELVAAIAAAIAESEGVPADGVVVRSIRRRR